jgi:hypothetical protein
VIFENPWNNDFPLRAINFLQAGLAINRTASEINRVTEKPFLFCYSLSFLGVNRTIKNGFIAFLIHTRYIPDPEQLNQQRFKCAAQMREPL